jgi:tetratricopeptide (TPR) repeat protein
METKDTPDQPTPFKRIMTWVGTASALIGFFASLAGGYHWLVNHREQEKQLKAQMAVAEGQAKLGEYASAVASYDEILKANPMYAPALNGQLDTAMAWDENFSVLEREGHDASEVAAPQLDKIMAVLDAGLARSTGSRAADVQAHLGWAHFLNSNSKIGMRELDSNAEKYFRAALKTDPNNVYANAMLGNFLLQTRGDFADAVVHLRAAVATGKERAWVRGLEFGGLDDDEQDGARAELMKMADEMRKNGEPLDEGSKHRLLEQCCDPPMTHHHELVESLSAVPQEDAWKTYLWLDDRERTGTDAEGQRLMREFIQDTLLEIEGKKAEALEKYRALQVELKPTRFSLQDSVNEAIARLSKG